MILLHRLTVQNFKQLADVTLHFPETGTILIEGHNEAGKSSLFEAVYFALYGDSLISDRDYKISDMKRHGAELMHVELEFSINARRFRVERTVRQNQKAHLTCPLPDGGDETITGADIVNRRIQEEIALSANALLNTCFVEQKRLDQLESLDPQVRRKTINELLNIEALNALEREFKPTQEDSERIQQAWRRVEVAELDAKLPELEHEERTAYRCMLYRQAQVCQEQSRAIAAEIRAAQEEQGQITARLAQIEADLKRGAQYQAQLSALQNDLPLRAEAWQRALREHADAAEEEQRLRALQAGLAERRETLEQYRQWESDLRKLEALEAEAKELADELKGRQDEVAAYDALFAEWQAVAEEVRQQEAQQAQEQQALEAAQAAWEARQRAIRRDTRLALLLQQADAHAHALREAATLAQELRTAQAHADALPAEQERLTGLENAEQWLNRRKKEADRLVDVRDKLLAARRRKEEHDTTQAQVSAQEQALRQLEAEISQSRARWQEARITLESVEQRAALLEWVEAAERCAEAEPNAGKLADLTVRRAQAEQQWKAASAQAAAAGKPMVAGLASAGGGLALSAAAFATPFLVPLLLLGLLLAAAGTGLALRARRAVVAARTAEEAARSACHALEGERSALEGLAKAHADQLERRKAEEEARRRALLALNLAIPESPEAARKQAAALPATALVEAKQAEEAAKSALDSLNNQRQILEGQIQGEKERLAKQNIQQVVAAIGTLQDQEAQTLQALEEADRTLPPLLESLSIGEDPEAIQEALQQARNVVAAYDADAARLPTLRRQEAEKRAQAQRAQEQTQAIAIELGLPETTITAWQSAAIEEQQALQAARREAGDEDLYSQWKAADQALQATSKSLAILQHKQAERRKQLDATDRTQLLAQVAETEQALHANAEAQRPLHSVRAALRAAELPDISTNLQVQLSLLQKELSNDEAEAARLPQARERVQQCARIITQKAEEFSQAWNQHLRAYAPPVTPDTAQERLSEVSREIDGKLQALDVPGLRQKQQTLQDRHTQIGQENAARDLRQTQLADQARTWLQELGIDAEEERSPLERFPELQQAPQRSAEAWAEEHERRSSAVHDTRTRRRTLAETLGLDDTPLDLPTERQALREAQKALDVKRRAERIVKTTRQSIVDRVMPMTLHNVRYLLPALTMGRYQDLEWQGEADSLLIFDSRAGAFQKKRVFSGGAKDQISLALRLGFALATLPTGKTTRPYWLFLDEPLSSFDRERTRALVDLLTRGTVRQHFHQVFLVSHSESFDPKLFDYRIRMANGSVVESTLP